MTAPHPIVLAAGGTGGHIFPAQSLAGVLAKRGYRIALVTDKRANVLDGALATADIYRVRAAGIAGKNPLRRLIGVAELGLGYFQAKRILEQVGPLAVVGFGSYASVPALAAAVSLGHRTVIHEQNAVLGRANRFLAPKVTRIATAFQSVDNLRDEDRSKTSWTGNPVRPEIVDIAAQPYPALEEGGLIKLLVFGGSLGAIVFTKVVPRALAALPETLRRRIVLVQQCHEKDIGAVREIYSKAGISAELAPFFEDMPDRLAAAHLVLSRAGASTIAELTAAGRPAILVPFPHATDDHQTKNAESLCDAGGGWMIPQSSFDEVSLGSRLTSLLSDTRRLRTTGMCAGRMGMRAAAEKLADVVLDAAGADGDQQRGGPAPSREAAE